MRLPPSGRENVRAGVLVKRYEAAISHLHEMSVYSTATGTSFRAQRRLRTQWIKPFQTSRGVTFETLIAPTSALSATTSAASPFAAIVSPSVSQPQVVSSLGTWTPIGPSDAGGRARALLINPSSHDSRIMLLATAGGGIWRTVDSGESWTPVFDDKPTLSISTLAAAPSDYRVVYAGTGEGFENYDAIKGNGVYRSTDNGITWTTMSGTKDNGDFSYVLKLAVSPSDPNRVYAATGTGVFVCCSTGGTWQQLGTTSGPLNTSSINGCTDVAIENKPPESHGINYVFVACGNLAAGAIYRTVDGSVPTSLEPVLPVLGRSSLAISSSEPSTIYAMAADATAESSSNRPDLQNVFRSTQDGATQTWTPAVDMGTRLNQMLVTNIDYAFNATCRVWSSLDNRNRLVFVNTYFDQGWYDNVLAVDPTNAHTIWAGGVDVFRSDDIGANWGIAGYWRTTKATAASAIHADVHAIVFHPDYGKANRTIFIATDGGVFRTDNASADVGHDPCGLAVPANPIKWAAVNAGLSTIQFYSGSLSPDGRRFIGGTQDNGTFVGSEEVKNTNGGAPPGQLTDTMWQWKRVIDGDGGTTAIDSYNPKNVYATLPPTDTAQIYKSTTGPDGKFDLAGTSLSGNFLFVTPLVMDSNSTATLWTGGSQVFRSTNAANTWMPASNYFSADNYGDEDSGIISALAVSPFDSNVVLAGTYYQADETHQIGGWIHWTNIGLTSNGQTSWKRFRPRRGWVSSIAFDPQNKGVVYATYSSFNSESERGHIFKNNSNGEGFWVPMDGPCDKVKPTTSNVEPCNTDSKSLPDIPVHSIAVDPHNSQRMWVGTDIGIFTSLDGGGTWAEENAGFRVPVSMLVLDPKAQMLYAFTHGRGVWRVKLN
jgi:hypothetical protein